MPIDASALTAPPKKSGAPRAVRHSSSPSAAPTASSKRAERAEGLQGIVQLLQVGLVTSKQYADAAAVGLHGENITKEIAALADTYESIAKPIDTLIQAGPFGALIAASMPLVLQVMANHKVIDAGSMSGTGVVSPNVLEAQVKTDLAKMEIEAAKAQQRAMDEARKAQDELAKMQSGGVSV